MVVHIKECHYSRFEFTFDFNPRDGKKQSAIMLATTQRGGSDTEALGHIPNYHHI